MIDAGALWRKRRSAFWQEAARYWRDVGRAGLPTLLMLVFIVGSSYYIRSLQSLPPDFPYRRITTPLLLLALAVTPIRTFLRDADRVFLLPAETQLQPFFRLARRYAFLTHTVAIAAVLAAVWPLYAHAAGGRAVPFAAALALLAAAKWAAVRSRWAELQLVRPLHRRAVAAMRWTASAAVADALLTRGLLQAALLAAAAALAVGGAAAVLPKQRIPWERLIRKEADHRRAHYTFYSWFTDVPELPARIRRNRWADPLIRRIPFGPRHAFLYLYARTFQRSEPLAMLIRLTLLALLVLAVATPPALLAAAYGVTVVVAAGQLASLEAVHRFSPWLRLYPLDARLRADAVVRLARFALLPQHAVLLAALLWRSGSLPLTAACGVCGIAFTLVYTSVALRRRLNRRLAEAE